MDLSILENYQAGGFGEDDRDEYSSEGPTGGMVTSDEELDIGGGMMMGSRRGSSVRHAATSSSGGSSDEDSTPDTMDEEAKEMQAAMAMQSARHMRSETRNLVRDSRADDWTDGELSREARSMTVALELQASALGTPLSREYSEPHSSAVGRHSVKKSSKLIKHESYGSSGTGGIRSKKQRRNSGLSSKAARSSARKLEQIVSTINELSEMVEQRQKRLTKLSSVISQKSRTVEARDIVSFRQKLQDIQDKIEDSSGSLETWDRDTRKLEKQMEQLRSERDSLKITVKKLKQELDEQMMNAIETSRSPSPGRGSIAATQPHERSGSVVYHHSMPVVHHPGGVVSAADHPGGGVVQGLRVDPMGVSTATRVHVTPLSPHSQDRLLYPPGSVSQNNQPGLVEMDALYPGVAGTAMLTQSQPMYQGGFHDNQPDLMMIQPGMMGVSPGPDYFEGRGYYESSLAEENRRKREVLLKAGVVVVCGVALTYFAYKMLFGRSSGSDRGPPVPHHRRIRGGRM